MSPLVLAAAAISFWQPSSVAELRVAPPAPIVRAASRPITKPAPAASALSCGSSIPDPNVYGGGMPPHYDYIAAPRSLTVQRDTLTQSDPGRADSLTLGQSVGTVLSAGGYTDLPSGRWWWVGLSEPAFGATCHSFMWVADRDVS